MPTGRTTVAYAPTEEELMALEAELAAQEAVPSPGLGGGSYEAVPTPPPPQAAPPQPTYSVTDAGTYSGAGTGYPPPQAAPTAPVPPPPGQPTADFAAPLGQLRDAVAASDAGRAVGSFLSAPLPGTETLPPPPTQVGQRLATGDPLGAGQLVADVAGEDPLTTASLLLGGPVVGAVGRGLLGLGRAAGVARTAVPVAQAIKTGSTVAPIARPATQTLDQLLRAKRLEKMSPLRRLAEEHGGLAGLAIPAAAVGVILKDFDPSGERAPSTGTAGGGAAGGTSTTRPPASGSASAAPATSTPTTTVPTNTAGTGGTGARQTTNSPVGPSAGATLTTPASAPARSSSPASVDTDDDLLATLGLLDDPVDVASAEPFTASDFTGRLGNLPGLGSVTPEMAGRMARIANGRLRRRRGKRTGAFTMERGEFHRLIRESVMESLRSNRHG